MTDSERIAKIVEWSGLSVNAFTLEIGYKKGQSIYNILGKGKGKPRHINVNVATKISNRFPEISYAWILTGEGNMLKEQPDNTVANEQLETYEPKNENDTVPRSEYEFIKKQLEEKDKQISKLLNLLSLSNSEFEEDKKEEVA